MIQIYTCAATIPKTCGVRMLMIEPDRSEFTMAAAVFRAYPPFRDSGKEDILVRCESITEAEQLLSKSPYDLIVLGAEDSKAPGIREVRRMTDAPLLAMAWPGQAAAKARTCGEPRMAVAEKKMFISSPLFNALDALREYILGKGVSPYNLLQEGSF